MAAVDGVDQQAVLFYGPREDFFEFSNFFPAAIHLDGKDWPTTEHYFQAQKFTSSEALQEKVRGKASPHAAADEGRNRRHPLREDWEQVKDEVMYKALAAKFSQHKELGDVLLSTGDRKLVEHTRNDSYWGDGGDGSGRNMLGKLLMRGRQELGQSLAKDR
jgi:ribA/ribD-fused uncharacterized protein